MERRNISLKTVNEDILFGFAWEAQNPVGCVFIVTGMEECAYRYDDFARFLVEHNYSVFCLDHYGQGENAQTEDQLGIVPRSFFSKTVRNLEDLIKKYSIKKKPIIVLGHSMGSFITQDFIQRYSRRPTKAIIMGSNGDNNKLTYKFGYPIARLVCKFRGENNTSRFLKNMSVGAYSKSVKDRKTPNDWLSYNEENVKAYTDDPKCGHDSSNGFYRELIKGNNRLYKDKFLKKINKDLPILVIAGEDDPVGAFGKGPRRLEKMYKELGIKDVELKLYPHMRHEILNETGKEQVYNDILEFIQK